MNKSYNIDCMEYMAGCQDNQFDLAVVDPNYGIKAGKKTKYHAGALTKYKSKSWDDKPPTHEYFAELFRVSNYQIIWGGNYFTQYLPASKNWIVWDKMQPNGVSFSMHELAFCNIHGQAKIFKHYNGGNRCSNSPENAIRYIKIHPAQKPIALYKWILKNYAKPGWSILDTHEGSASNKIACHDMGFDYTGCELDQDYYKASQERFKNHVAQKDIFTTDEYQDLMYTQGEI